MKVVLLAGGLGTRLREETEFKPKPMVEVGSRPVLWHIMKLYAHYGVNEFVVCTGYRGEVIKDYFLNYDARNNDFTVDLGGSPAITFHDRHRESEWLVTVSDTGQDTQTGGRVHRVRRYLDEGTFMVTYGDGIADVDIASLLAFHRTHGHLATLTAVRPMSRFGVLDLDEGNGKVQQFREKPQAGGWINAGFFVFEPAVLDYLGGDECVLESEPLRALADAGELVAYRHDGFFQPMDTYREAKLLTELWEGEAPWKVWSE